MGFEQLIEKVTQAEHALEARERSVGADWRQFKHSWRAAWTPGRIVVAGLASGFLVGRNNPLKRASGGGVLQLITALSGLMASGSAQAAANEAGQAAQNAGATAEAVGADPVAVAQGSPPPVAAGVHDPVQHHEHMRRRGLV